MQVERFQAKTMREALDQVKRQLGEDAVILATRTVKTRSRGIFPERCFEVSAMRSEAEEKAPEPARQLQQQPAPLTADDLERMIAPLLDPLRREIRSVRNQLHGATGPLRQDLRQTIEELRATVSRVSDSSAGPFADMQRRLVDMGLSPALASILVSEAREGLGDEPLHGEEGRAVLTAAVEQAVTRRVSVCPELAGANRPERVVVLVGPTGVGKTTTVAKLASIASLVEGRKVALVTMDTYRVGGVDQLRRYAALIGIPCSVASDGPSFRAALETHQDADLVLVDTAGRSPRQPGSIASLGEALAGGGEPAQVLLLVGAATRLLELEVTLRRYAELEPNGLIVTKTDEAVGGGAVIEACVRSHLPVSFMCTGQRVPEDIVEATAPRLAAFVLGQEEN